jgi:hypothetical protein
MAGTWDPIRQIYRTPPQAPHPTKGALAVRARRTTWR